MSSPAEEAHDYGVPAEFYCEHSASKSRVLVLVRQPERLPALHAVLTCTDQLLAHRIAAILYAAVESGRSTQVTAEAERIAASLPDAPAASYRQALDAAFALRWQLPGRECTSYEDLHASYSTEPTGSEPTHPLTRDRSVRTPSEANASELAHTVVRVTRTVDLHVHAPERLLSAARAGGWERCEELSDDRDPQDLLDAALWVVDERPAVPGVDVARQSAEGEYLSIQGRTPDEEHDLLAEWYSQLADMFPDSDDTDDWIITPRTADGLHAALSILADEGYDDVEELGDAPIDERTGCSMLDRLPRLSWHQDAQWRRQMARAADDLVADLEAGYDPVPRCNAEELCLHLAIADAPGWLEGLEANHRHHALPSHSQDYDWDGCSEMLFQDHDILLLNQRWADGVEDPDDEWNRYAGVGDLRPAKWFQPFNNVESRDPARGFRR